MIERRLSKKMVSYWHTLHNKANALPKVVAYSHGAVEGTWPYCIQISAKKEPNVTTYVYEYVGKEIVKMLGKNPVGKQITTKVEFIPAGTMINKIGYVLEHPQPTIHEGQFSNKEGAQIKYRSCILPFSDNGESVTHFIIGISWQK